MIQRKIITKEKALKEAQECDHPGEQAQAQAQVFVNGSNTRCRRHNNSFFLPKKTKDTFHFPHRSFTF